MAFPTETVYGLGADASSPAAVRRLFRVKGRPSDHPVIVHVASINHVPEWVSGMPGYAVALAGECWPGPLTLVLPRSPRVPDEVTGGLDTVGIRVPAERTAQALLRAFGGGVAAPSANRFGRVSPTTADDVRADLGADVDVVLDGGPSRVGVESTIVDCSGAEPAILRVGGISREKIEEIVGRPVPVRDRGEVRAPGTLASHYAPRAAWSRSRRSTRSRRSHAPSSRPVSASASSARGNQTCCRAMHACSARRATSTSTRTSSTAGCATPTPRTSTWCSR